MTILCITGAPAPALHHVDALLRQAGMAPAQDLNRQPPITLQGWHQRVLASPGSAGTAAPGRLWDQLAADLFLANMDAPLWGWADPRSTALLDYWAQFEPGVRFVLLCQTPQQALAALIDQPDAAADVAGTLAEWQDKHQAMLRFHLRNPQRSVLLWAEDALQRPAALLQHCADQLGLALALQPLPTDLPAAVTAAAQALAQYLASQIAAGHPELDALLQELQATVVPLAPPAGPAAAAQPVPHSEQGLIDAFHALSDRAPELQALAALRLDLQGLAADNAELQARQAQQAALAQQLLLQQQADHRAEADALRLEQAQASQRWQEAVAVEVRARGQVTAQCQALAQQVDDLEAAGQAEAQSVRRLQAQFQEARQDGAALLQQLLQTQAALQQSLLAQADTEQRCAALEQRHRDAADAAAQAAAQCADLARVGQQAGAQLLESQQENELLLLQLQQAQEELETELVKHAESGKRLAEALRQQALQSQATAAAEAQRDAEAGARQQALARCDALTAERSALVAAHDGLAGERLQLLAARDAERAARAEADAQRARDAQARAQAESQLQEAQEDNELLLLQLRQAQEELETCFQQQQAAQDQVQAAQARWQRMLQRNPGYCDFTALDLLPTQPEHPDQTRWRIRGLEAAGRQFDQLEFFTAVDRGVLGLGFERAPGTTGALLRWPASAAGSTQLLALPAGDAETLRTRVAILGELATGDWDLLQVLPEVMGKRQASQAPALTAPLANLQQLIGKLPPMLRYDTLQLLREQVNPDYEHLWLRLGNVALGAQRVPSVEFRLACANVGPDRFGLNPKLEFPLGAKAALENWFDESEDDFGPKLELRFALPGNMDTQVWAQVSPRDRQFITALLACLPRLLDQLPAIGAKPRRPLEQWQTMAVHMLRVIRQLAAPPKAAVPAPAPVPVPAAAVPKPVAPPSPVPAPEPVPQAPAARKKPAAARKTKARQP